MSRRQAKPQASREELLAPAPWCWGCGQPTLVAYHRERRILHLEGLCRYTLVMRRCPRRTCTPYRRSVGPAQEGSLALPHGEVGLDVIALVGRLRFAAHRSVPEIHQELGRRGLRLAQRTVTNLLYRYEELLSLHRSDPARLRTRLAQQEQAVLAIDGLQPEVGHEVLWVLREVRSGEVVLARGLLGATADDLAPLLREAVAALPVPVVGVISDGQQSIRRAVAATLPGVPHQLCQFHYLREAAKEVYEADRHAKTQLKKAVRGVRPIERALEEQPTAEASAVRGYCAAVRSALTDDGRPPLCAAGPRLQERLEASAGSLERVVAKGGDPG